MLNLYLEDSGLALDSLFEEWQGKATQVCEFGDRSEVEEIKTAIWSANEVARKNLGR